MCENTLELQMHAPNLSSHRCLLSLVGLSSIGLGLLVSYGICQLFGAYYTPMHQILPFLLLGIGIDDMFVIVQSMSNIGPDLERE